MYLNARFRLFLPVLAGALLVSACSTLDAVAPGRKKVDYKKSKATEALEVPPGLSSSTINDAPGTLDTAGSSISTFNEGLPVGASIVLPDQSNMQFERDGDQQWLVVQGTPSQVWPKVREFWLEQGFLVKMEDPRVGILETGWSENRADIPQGPIRNLLGKVIDSAYTAATRDQYRVRLERGGEPLTTEVYLTHRGVEEVIKGSVEDNATVWKPRPSDPELEAEMLKRMMVFLGVEERKAEAMLQRQVAHKPRAQLVSVKSGSMLMLEEDFSRAWRRTGVALDRVGFAVEDRNRSEGIYYVRYNDPLADQDKEGILNKLAFWSSDDEDETIQYQIEVQAHGASTHIVVNDSQGVRDTSSTAKRILSLLEEELR